MPQPRVVIAVQPSLATHRFRYKRECRLVGPIYGVNSTQRNKTYPTIRIENFTGEVTVVVSCVTVDWPFKPHPHSLVGKAGCVDGVCCIRASVTETANEYQFRHIGIQCVKRDETDINNALSKRAKLGFDPFRRITELTPAVSDIIYDKKALYFLNIAHISHSSGSVAGGLPMILICEKVKPDDIAVMFYEKDESGRVVWEACANSVLVHKQVAIMFKTPPYNPPYYDPNSHQGQIIVNIQLKRISNDERSNSILFEYIPVTEESNDKVPGKIPKKQKMIMPCLMSDKAKIETPSYQAVSSPGPSCAPALAIPQQVVGQGASSYHDPYSVTDGAWDRHNVPQLQPPLQPQLTHQLQSEHQHQLQHQSYPQPKPHAHPQTYPQPSQQPQLQYHSQNQHQPQPQIWHQPQPIAGYCPGASVNGLPQTSPALPSPLSPYTENNFHLTPSTSGFTDETLHSPTKINDQQNTSSSELSFTTLLKQGAEAADGYDVSQFSLMEECENLSGSLLQLDISTV